MIPLTPKQFALLKYLRSCEVCPSYEEMATKVGVASKSNVVRLLAGLEERGYIARGPGHTRNVILVQRDHPLEAVPTERLQQELSRRKCA